MTLQTPINSIPYPELTDIPNALVDFQNFANAIDGSMIPRFASATARDAAITSPTDGNFGYRTDIHALQYYSGTTISYVSPGETLIAKNTLGVDTATVTFSGIPQDFTHLRFRMLVRSTTAATTDTMSLRFNSDSSASYDWTTTLWNDSTSPGTASTGSNGTVATSLRITSTIDAASATAGFFSKAILDVPFYSDGTTSRTKGAQANTALTGFPINLGAGNWVPSGPTAITTIAFITGGNFKAGSVFALYGVS